MLSWAGMCRHNEGFGDKHYYDLILWNPLTGEYKTSKTNSDLKCYEVDERTSTFFYSSSDDDYKLLRLTLDGDAYIYSLKSDSWRNVETTQEFMPI